VQHYFAAQDGKRFILSDIVWFTGAHRYEYSNSSPHALLLLVSNLCELCKLFVLFTLHSIAIARYFAELIQITPIAPTNFILVKLYNHVFA